MLALTGPGQTAGLSVFTEPLIEDLDISRTRLSGAYLAATLTGAALLPLVGRALDRFGVRSLATCAAVLFGAMLAGCATVGSIWGLTAGLAGLRLSGQGALSLLATTTVALWFTRNRGTSLGLVTSVGAAGISVTPVLTERLIAATDWRTAWLIQGLVIWAILIPVGLYVLRGRPPVTVLDTPSAAGDGWTVGRAMHTAAFWTIIATVCCQGMLTTAVAFHQVSLLGEHGLSPTEAAANFLPQTMAGLAAAFLVGALADRFPHASSSPPAWPC
ncbi:MFS transporter [Actinomadura sp. 3N407]|uniref:MFS transporter n=1 Tax=Actinomadura sp. 3N407 TaxID=3457423 RepID=UPI003FCDB077